MTLEQALLVAISALVAALGILWAVWRKDIELYRNEQAERLKEMKDLTEKVTQALDNNTHVIETFFRKQKKNV